MPLPESLREQWESYRAAVLPADVSRVQLWETRRAFYAGAFGMLCAFKGIGEEDVPEPAGVAAIEGLHAEAMAFYRDVKAGKA